MIILTVAVVLSLCAVSGGAVWAKYLNEKSSNGIVGTHNFYFTSNLLDGQKHTLAPGSTSVTFTLGNHADDLRFSDVDINYTVTVAPEAEISPANGTLSKGRVNDAEVTVSSLQAGIEYTITAVGEGGFTQTLTATVVVPQNEARLYYHIDVVEGEYTLLTVWNEGDAAGDVQITYTGIPDNTNPNMEDWMAGVAKNVTVQAHTSLVYRFFGGEVTVTGASNKELN